MEIKFSLDKQYNKPHFQVNHPDISEDEILEVFSNIYVKFESPINKVGIIGHTNTKRFLVIIGIYGQNKQLFRVITAYPARKKHLILYKKGLKNE